jgi:hypothetical protein
MERSRPIETMLSKRLHTAPHRSRKKRELTRAVEILKKENGGGIEAHRLLSAPLALSANVSLD